MGEMDSADRILLRNANICQTFPAYRIEDIAKAPARPLLRAMQLLRIQNKVARSLA